MDRLKVKRTVLRGKCTKVINEAKALLGSDDSTPEEINECVDRLSAVHVDLRHVNTEMEPLIPTGELEKELTASCDYDQEATKTLSLLKYRLRPQLGAQPSPVSSPTPTPDSGRGETVRETGPRSGVRLPKLELPKFNGELCQWQPFWERFQDSIHNTTLSRVDKFHYLKSSLTGAAAAAITGLQVSEACYNDALAILKSRFGDKKRIEKEHLGLLRRLPVIKSASDTRGLRRFYDHVTSHMRGLEALGVEQSSYSAMMADILLRSLPAEMGLDYYRKTKTSSAEEGSGTTSAEEGSGTTEDELKKIMKFLQVEVESREECGLGLVTDSRNQHRKGGSQGQKPPSALVLHSEVTGRKSCYFCDGCSHSTEQCNAELDLAFKKEKLKQDRRCFRCTARGHRSNECRRRIKCSHCRGRHATSVCDPDWPRRTPTAPGAAVTTVANSVCLSRAMPTAPAAIYLQTFRAWAVSDDQSLYIRGLFDNGSQKTFIREDIAQRLKLPVLRELDISINTFASPSTKTAKHSLVRLNLRSQFNSEDIPIEAVVIPVICRDLPSASAGDQKALDLMRNEHDVADAIIFPGVPQIDGISLLIGSDQMWKILTGEIRRYHGNTGLVAMNSMLGWTLQGPSTVRSFTARQTSNMVCVLRTNVDASLEDSENYWKRLWEIENVGIVDELPSAASSSILQHFEDTVAMTDGRYEVRLPWKSSGGQLGDNFEVARTRLNKLVNRLIRDPQLLNDYDEAIRSYGNNDHAEVVPANEVWPDHVYYMPHREVIRESSTTTKLRVVFDASSHSRGVASLNDCLETGPKLNPDILDILLRFRTKPVAVTSDIQKAFLQINVHKADRDALRFLWFEEIPSQPSAWNRIVEWRMTRVPFGTTASPFLLAATLRHHLSRVKEDLQPTASIMAQSFYVDDLVVVADDEAGGLRLYEEARLITNQARMVLAKWTSNSAALQEKFRADGVCDQASESTLKAKVLGIGWDKEQDTLAINFDNVLNDLPTAAKTKRAVLQLSARVFDPLGFLNPFTVRARLLFQTLWKEELGWDEAIPGPAANIWDDWTTEIHELEGLQIPRCIFPPAGSEIEYHIFCDASPQAYGAAAYVRYRHSVTGNVASGLLFSKVRVAPLKELSLPRLELLAALIGSRMIKYLRNVLQDSESSYFMWTDSMIALCWIAKPSKNWKVFVGNRVEEIQSSTNRRCWNHCPSKDNPADLLTRGIPASKLVSSRLWWDGPAWLSESNDKWPKQPEVTSDLAAEEARSCAVNVASLEPEPIVELCRHSRLVRVLRITAWVHRFIRNCRKLKGCERIGEPLTAAEIKDAELYWVKVSQSVSFGEEIANLRDGKEISASSRLALLHPFLDDDDVLRLQGRLQEADVSEDTKHPAILPNDHRFTELLAADTHHRLSHSGVDCMLADLRQRFWVLRARQLCKKVVHRCRVCQRFRVKAISAPVAPLPRERITRSLPFQVVGVDFAGPLLARVDTGTRKVYIALFTCAVVRAIHLELVSDLGTDTFLQALRRFTARRGFPQIIYSDNAATFKRASKDLQTVQRVVENAQVQDYLSTNRIQWKFIAEKAAWWGGWWERLVGSVKVVLRKVLGRATLTAEELVTCLMEAEAVVNSRPITYQDASDPNVLPLTPGHFLIGRQLRSLPDQPIPKQVPTAPTALAYRRKLQYQRRLMDRFWTKWTDHYLLQLRSAHSFPNQAENDVKEGDVVLMHESHRPRLIWKLGVIKKTFTGRDGHVRACEVKLSNGTILRRPVQLLYPMEMC